MARWSDQAGEQCAASIRPPDRRPTLQWAEDTRLALPGSLRSQRFRVDIAPWLRLPGELADRAKTRKLLLVAAVQSAKSTFGEVFAINRLATDPGNMLFNWENDVKAEKIWNERLQKTIRDASQLKSRMPSAKVKQRKLEMMFNDGMYFRLQGANTEANRQSRSVRYLVNEEVKDWPPGALSDMRNRSTAAWNSFELNITPGGCVGDEVHQLWLESSQHVFHIRCPDCGHLQKPVFRADKGKPGGLRICEPDDEDAVKACKPAPGVYDYGQIQTRCFYECEKCKHQWKDRPSERQQFVNDGEYVQMNPAALESDQSCQWSALIVPWIPWVNLIREFHTALRAMKYGDISLFRDFVQKREAEFFDENQERDAHGESTLTVKAGLTKHNSGISDKLYRAMTVDKQRGETGRGESPHYWAVVRDFTGDKAALLYEGKVQTDEEVEELRIKYDVPPLLVWVDSGDGMTMLDVYRMCARFGYVAIKGENKAMYTHIDERGKRTQRRYSQEQTATATDRTGKPHNITLILYSKQSIRDALHYLRSQSEFDYEIPEDVSEDYKKHMDAEALVDWHIPKTGQTVKIWKQMKKRNDLFVCECYQALIADMMGLLGSFEVAERPDYEEHANRG